MNGTVATAEPVRERLVIKAGQVSVLHWNGAAKDAPAVHFAHANGFNALTYRAILGQAAKHFHVWASDLRGHGRTGLPADPKHHPGWQVYAGDLVATLEALKSGPVILAGHSMGATASLMAAIHRPDLVRGLVLADPVIFAPAAHAMGMGMRALGLFDRVVPIAKQAERRRPFFAGPEEAFKAYRGRGAFKTWPDAFVHDYLEGGLVETGEPRQWRLACAPEWEAANYRASPPFVWHRLSRVRCPVVLLTAEKGSTCRAPAPQLLQLRLAHCDWRQVPGTSHFLPMEAPDAVLKAFLDVAAMADRQRGR